MNKTFLLIVLAALFASGCQSTDGGIKRTKIRDCPPGWILMCETRRPQEPSRGGDEEIPEYDFCTCERFAN